MNGARGAGSREQKNVLVIRIGRILDDLTRFFSELRRLLSAETGLTVRVAVSAREQTDECLFDGGEKEFRLTVEELAFE